MNADGMFCKKGISCVFRCKIKSVVVSLGRNVEVNVVVHFEILCKSYHDEGQKKVEADAQNSLSKISLKPKLVEKIYTRVVKFGIKFFLSDCFSISCRFVSFQRVLHQFFLYIKFSVQVLVVFENF